MNDRVIMFIMIPVISGLIPLLFLGYPLDTYLHKGLPVYLNSLIITAVLWLGNRKILLSFHHQSSLKKPGLNRLSRQLIYMLMFTIIASNALGFILNVFTGVQTAGLTRTEILLRSNGASIISTLTIAALYESLHYRQQIRKSVAELTVLENEVLLTKLNALKSQLDPHFFFNNLNTLTAVIHSDPAEAIRYVQQLAIVYRYMLDIRDAETVTVNEELSVLTSYQYLIRLRFEESIRFQNNLPASVSEYRIIPWVLQMLSENAIKHNFFSKTNPLIIELIFEKGHIILRNNRNPRSDNSTSGTGLRNINERCILSLGKKIAIQTTPYFFTVKIPVQPS